VGSDLGTATFTQTGASIIGYNTALYSGGGLYVDNGIAVLASGQVISNTAEGTDSDRGGGLYASGIASVAVSGGQILSNTARRGGGMYLDLFDLGDATLTSGEIRGNIAQDGGGMYIYEGNATLNGGQIVNNTADNGGSVYANAGSVTLSGGQITNNSVTSNSSALYNDSSMINTTTILTITGDIYQEGGVFSCDGNSLVLQGSLTLAGGTFTAPSTELRIAGDLTRSGGTFDANGGNVFFHGAGIQTLNANTITFYSVTVNSGVTLTTESVVTVNGGVALETGAATQETRSVSSTDLLAFALADLTITPATQGNLSSLRVTRVEISHPDAAGGIQTNRYWSIAAIGSGYTATLTLPHDGLSDPYACKYTGSGWEGARDSFDSTTVTRSDITSFSDWGVSDGLPTAVTLASFTATPQEGGILVAWETAIEIDNVGFNLYRTQAPEGAWVRLNDTLIPSQSPGSVFGTTYAWLDENVETGTTYYYKLEDIEVGGKHTFHGPVAAQPTEPAALVLRSFGIPGSPAIALLVLLGICSPAIVWRVRKRR
ncbi:MAG: hypothetical protein JXA14_03375, partial [Anaerolineae bacterium]|nr:hypothetical protein [Anaerolineae bacterium]